MNPRTKYRLCILGAALLFSTGGAAIKATAFGPWQVASFRAAVAAAVIAALVPGSRRIWNWRILPAGMCFAAVVITFVFATKLTTAANAIFLQDTAPLYLLILGPLLLKEPLRRDDLLLAGVLAAGLALFFVGRETAVASAPDPLRGNIIAVSSGAVWALTILSLRWLGKHSGAGGSISAVLAGNIICALVCGFFALPFPAARAADWVIIFYLGAIQIAYAYFLLSRAMPHVPAFEATALLLVEPVFNPVWAWLFQNERPSALALTGGAIILGATAVHTWKKSRIPATANGTPELPE